MQGNKNSLEKFIVGFLIFSLIILSTVAILISSSGTYKAAKDLLQNDETLRSKIGNVKGFGLIPYGSVQESSKGDTIWGTATLDIIVKGENKFTDVTITIKKQPASNWVIVKLED